ncbi:MAG: DUF1269 domain-containing protein [Anaerolineae bacterium]|nr:DUF1269 domain-containing protein [Anaerolineae bacterium]
MGSTIAIVTFDHMEKAGEVLKAIHTLEDEHLVDLKDSAVVVKDENGKLEAHEASKFSAGRGIATGGALGFMIGAALGGPVGGVLVGGAIGAWAAKKVDLGISNKRIEEVSAEMPNGSSALFIQVKKVERKGLLNALVRESGGTVIEVEFTDGDEANMFDLTTDYTSHRAI